MITSYPIVIHESEIHCRWCGSYQDIVEQDGGWFCKLCRCFVDLRNTFVIRCRRFN